jgi:hypothetical protein
VIYGNQKPWPPEANGGSNSLHRASLARSGNEPANWFAALPDPGVFVALDADSDGIPDSWELQYSLNPSDPNDAAEDADGDGMTNLQEYLAGTDPRDTSSRLQFDAVFPRGEGLVLRFTASIGKSYSIQSRVAVSDGTWDTCTNIPPPSATGPVEILDPAMNATTLFYRLVTPAIQ